MVHSVFSLLPLYLFLLEMSKVELSGSDAKIKGRSPFLGSPFAFEAYVSSGLLWDGVCGGGGLHRT